MPETPTPNPGPDFLEDKYNLHNKPEVASAARRTEVRTGEAVPDDAAERIQNYLDRFTEILEREDPDKRQRGIEALKEVLRKQFVIKPSDIPQGYYDLQGRLVEERGQRKELEQVGVRIEEYADTQGQTKKHYHYPDRLKQELNTTVIADQVSSLNLWLDYLTSSDATYPDWLKYYAMRGVLSLGGFDKEKRQFEQRRIDTVKTFPDLNREALAYVLDALEKKYGVEYFELREQLAANTRAFHLLERYESKRQIVDSAAVQEPTTLSAKATVLSIALPGGRTVRMKRRDLEQLQSELPSTPPFDRSELASTHLAVTQELSQLLADRHLPESFQGQLEEDDFGKLYTWALEKVTPASEEALSNTQGEWVKFDRGMDPMTDIPEGFDRPLVPSLQGHGTGWCTAGESTAKTQLNAGDFYVFYSLDDHGKASVPRAAIRMEHGKIAEVRGVAEQQNLDPAIAQVVGTKLAEFPDGTAYEKKAGDMQRLTAIEKKTNSGEQLDRADLTFLYELDAPIQGFGYQEDPRIAELRGQRDPTEDAPIVFGCEPNQIAHTVDAINSNTKAYVGELKAGIFNKIQEFNIEHVYTKFPEGKIRFEPQEIGGKTKEELRQEFTELQRNLQQKQQMLYPGAEAMMNDAAFTTVDKTESLLLVRLTVTDLGFPSGATIQEIYKKADVLGLDLCPAEVGPRYRLDHPKQRMGDWVLIGMEPIAGAGGSPDVFNVDHDDDGLRLYYYWAKPSHEWNSGSTILFRLRKST